MKHFYQGQDAWRSLESVNYEVDNDVWKIE